MKTPSLSHWLIYSLVVSVATYGWQDADDAFWDRCMSAAEACRYEQGLNVVRHTLLSRRSGVKTRSTNVLNPNSLHVFHHSIRFVFHHCDSSEGFGLLHKSDD